MSSNGGSVLAFGKKSPDIHASVFLADGSRVIGDVVIGKDSSIWFNAVIRGDVHRVRVGKAVNVQDNAVLHVTNSTAPLTIEDGVTIGHGAIVHGCTLRGGCLIGMGAVVLDHAVVGRNSIVAAGSVVREGVEIPDGVLAAGLPASVKRRLTPEEQQGVAEAAHRYVDYARTFLETYRER